MRQNLDPGELSPRCQVFHETPVHETPLRFPPVLFLSPCSDTDSVETDRDTPLIADLFFSECSTKLIWTRLNQKYSSELSMRVNSVDPRNARFGSLRSAALSFPKSLDYL